MPKQYIIPEEMVKDAKMHAFVFYENCLLNKHPRIGWGIPWLSAAGLNKELTTLNELRGVIHSGPFPAYDSSPTFVQLSHDLETLFALPAGKSQADFAGRAMSNENNPSVINSLAILVTLRVCLQQEYKKSGTSSQIKTVNMAIDALKNLSADQVKTAGKVIKVLRATNVRGQNIYNKKFHKFPDTIDYIEKTPGLCCTRRPNAASVSSVHGTMYHHRAPGSAAASADGGHQSVDSVAASSTTPTAAIS